MGANSESHWVIIIAGWLSRDSYAVFLFVLQNSGINSPFQGYWFMAYLLSVCPCMQNSFLKKGRKWRYTQRRTGCEGVYVLVLQPRSPRLTKSPPAPRSQIRILNERGMFGNKRWGREWKDIKGRGCQDFFFSMLGRRAFLKLALVWLGVKVEGKTPVE